MSVTDQEIEERLKKLKDGIPGAAAANIVTDDEIGRRLAQLKNVPESHYVRPLHTVIYQPPDKRSDVEKAADLFAQYQKEAELESRLPKPEDEIAERLAKLKTETAGLKPAKSHSEKMEMDSVESEDEAMKVKTLVGKFLAEAELDNTLGSDSTELKIPKEDSLNSSDSEEMDSEEESHMCVMCDKDASIQCPNCSGDKYCKGCFREYHDDNEDHKPFKLK